MVLSTDVQYLASLVSAFEQDLLVLSGKVIVDPVDFGGVLASWWGKFSELEIFWAE